MIIEKNGLEVWIMKNMIMMNYRSGSWRIGSKSD